MQGVYKENLIVRKVNPEMDEKLPQRQEKLAGA